jgi:hypothetical protein
MDLWWFTYAEILVSLTLFVKLRVPATPDGLPDFRTCTSRDEHLNVCP